MATFLLLAFLWNIIGLIAWAWTIWTCHVRINWFILLLCVIFMLMGPFAWLAAMVLAAIHKTE